MPHPAEGPQLDQHSSAPSSTSPIRRGAHKHYAGGLVLFHNPIRPTWHYFVRPICGRQPADSDVGVFCNLLLQAKIQRKRWDLQLLVWRLCLELDRGPAGIATLPAPSPFSVRMAKNDGQKRPNVWQRRTKKGVKTPVGRVFSPALQGTKHNQQHAIRSDFSIFGTVTEHRATSTCQAAPPPHHLRRDHNVPRNPVLDLKPVKIFGF